MTPRPVLAAIAVLAVFAPLAGCKPPPTDETAARGVMIDMQHGPSEPIDSPDSSKAVWADSATPGRLIYGNPGEAPMLALACVEAGGAPTLRFTRYALADEGAGAFLALIGNAHVARIPVDATAFGEAFLWEGALAAGDPDWEVLTGRREVTATIPGAGMVTLNPSDKPAALIEQCREPVPAETEPKADPATEPDPAAPAQ